MPVKICIILLLLITNTVYNSFFFLLTPIAFAVFQSPVTITAIQYPWCITCMILSTHLVKLLMNMTRRRKKKKKKKYFFKNRFLQEDFSPNEQICFLFFPPICSVQYSVYYAFYVHSMCISFPFLTFSSHIVFSYGTTMATAHTHHTSISRAHGSSLAVFW